MNTYAGYGDVVPTSYGGRIALMLYSVIGVPLLLLLTTDMAKFLGGTLTHIYIKYLELKIGFSSFFARFLSRKKQPVEEEEKEEVRTFS